MSQAQSVKFLSPAKLERRSSARQTMVLRVGLLQADGRTSFCLVKNISSSGVQVKLYGRYDAGTSVSLTVGDEIPLTGILRWIDAPLAGIEFDKLLSPDHLLRVTQKLSSRRRRSSPRLSLSAHILLVLAGQTTWGELCDISTSGARIRTRRSIPDGSVVTLRIPNLPPVRAFVRWADGEELGLVFACVMPIEILASIVGSQA